MVRVVTPSSRAVSRVDFMLPAYGLVAVSRPRQGIPRLCSAGYMSRGITLADVAKIIGISIPAAANREREGSLPFVRIWEGNGAFYFVSPSEAITAFRAGKRTGYDEPVNAAQDAAVRAADRRLKLEQAETRRTNRELNERNQAVREPQ